LSEIVDVMSEFLTNDQYEENAEKRQNGRVHLVRLDQQGDEPGNGNEGGKK
jgi:hypothetical protein